MSKIPTLRSRVLNLLRTARTLRGTGITVALLATILCVPPYAVLASVSHEMLETAEGADAPPVHCAPGPKLVLR